MIERRGPGRHTKLTPEVHKGIVQYIRDGAYDWVAAAALDVDQSTFYRWLKRPGPEYRAFSKDISRARAEARALAEAEVRKGDPFKWLRYGPGRERDGEPGWTDNASVKAEGSIAVVNYTPDQWRTEADKRRARAMETAAVFDTDEADVAVFEVPGE